MCEGKAKIPKDVAESIDLLNETNAGKSCLCDIPYMIECVEKKLPDASVFRPIVKFYLANSENKTIYFQAVTNGYELEETPEDKVMEYFNRLQRSTIMRKYPDDSHYEALHQKELHGQMRGVIETLNRLGIKIKGVNA